MLKRLLILLGMVLGACGGPAVDATGLPPGPAATRSLPPAFTSTPSPTPTPTFPATLTVAQDFEQTQRRAMLDDFAADVELLPDATRYRIQMTVTLGPSRNQALILGTARIRVKNSSPDALDEIVLRLWPNHPQYLAMMRVESALIEGEVVVPEVLGDGTSVRYALPKAWSAGRWMDLSVPFEVEVAGSINEHQPRRFGFSQEVLFAPTAYPVVPLLRESEWERGPAPLAGDTTNSETAFFHVTLTSPTELQLVASGSVVSERTSGGLRITEMVTGPMRDFAFALGEFNLGERQAAGTQLRIWVTENHAHELERMLAIASDQMTLMSELVGPYPYRELDVVDVAGAFGGIEYPGLITVGTVGTPFLVRPLVHEVAHQWFYGLIGDDQLREPWLDEAAASYFEIRYYESVQGSGAASGRLSSIRDQLRTHPEPEIPIGLPVDGYSPADYGLFVYRKGALFFDALRAKLGEGAFEHFLQQLYSRYRYRLLSAEEFQATAEAVCDCSLEALFDLWVYEGGDIPSVP